MKKKRYVFQILPVTSALIEINERHFKVAVIAEESATIAVHDQVYPVTGALSQNFAPSVCNLMEQYISCALSQSVDNSPHIYELISGAFLLAVPPPSDIFQNIHDSHFHDGRMYYISDAGMDSSTRELNQRNMGALQRADIVIPTFGQYTITGLMVLVEAKD